MYLTIFGKAEGRGGERQGSTDASEPGDLALPGEQLEESDWEEEREQLQETRIKR